MKRNKKFWFTVWSTVPESGIRRARFIRSLEARSVCFSIFTSCNFNTATTKKKDISSSGLSVNKSIAAKLNFTSWQGETSERWRDNATNMNCKWNVNIQEIDGTFYSGSRHDAHKHNTETSEGSMCHVQSLIILAFFVKSSHLSFEILSIAFAQWNPFFFSFRSPPRSFLQSSQNRKLILRKGRKFNHTVNLKILFQLLQLLELFFQ